MLSFALHETQPLIDSYGVDVGDGVGVAVSLRSARVALTPVTPTAATTSRLNANFLYCVLKTRFHFKIHFWIVSS